MRGIIVQGKGEPFDLFLLSSGGGSPGLDIVKSLKASSSANVSHSAVERIGHIHDRQGQVLALA